MLERLNFRSIQTGLLLFWSIWLTLVAATNLLDALKHLGALPDSWTLASGNFAMVAATVGAHGVPASIAAVLFAGLLAWESLAAGLFWRALGAFHREAPRVPAEVVQAFAVSLALWAAFLIATEASVDHLTAPTHMGILIAQLASLLVIRNEARTADVRPEAAKRVQPTPPARTAR